MKALRVLRGGLLTTVQDLGRARCRRWGVAPSGAADPFSARLANVRAGNPQGAAVLEMTASGCQFEVLVPIRIALAGADMPALGNGAPIDARTAVELSSGDLLELGSATSGFRTYLAVSGGIDVPEVLGSRATHLSAGFGGWNGRRLEPGDVISIFDVARAPAKEIPGSFPVPGARAELRAIPGPQMESFPAETIRQFFQEEFRVSSRSNRMGLRLEASPSGEGFSGGTAGVPEMAPEGSVAGAVQVPHGGEPIVHMPEGPVTGGYARIAAVISADLGLAGQLRPGGLVRFRETTIEEALRALREREMMLSEGPR
ncbi:MAG: biotin-dependent carboxyltransferase family protein [Thermoanaerobaculia bacterium]